MWWETVLTLHFNLHCFNFIQKSVCSRRGHSSEVFYVAGLEHRFSVMRDCFNFYSVQSLWCHAKPAWPLTWDVVQCCWPGFPGSAWRWLWGQREPGRTPGACCGPCPRRPLWTDVVTALQCCWMSPPATLQRRPAGTNQSTGPSRNTPRTPRWLQWPTPVSRWSPSRQLVTQTSDDSEQVIKVHLLTRDQLHYIWLKTYYRWVRLRSVQCCGYTWCPSNTYHLVRLILEYDYRAPSHVFKKTSISYKTNTSFDEIWPQKAK